MCPIIKSSQSNGFAKIVLQKGEENNKPPMGSNVEVHYVGRLLNGNLFDSSRDKNRTFSFDLGAGRGIQFF